MPLIENHLGVSCALPEPTESMSVGRSPTIFDVIEHNVDDQTKQPGEEKDDGETRIECRDAPMR